MDINVFSISRYKSILVYIWFIFLVFAVLNFVPTVNISLLLSQILFVCYVSLIIIYLIKGSLKYIFEPPVFFLGFCLMYEILKFPYYFNYADPKTFVDLNYLSNSVYKVQDYYEASVFGLIYQTCCIIILINTYKVSNKTIKNTIIQFNKIIDKSLLVTILICVVIAIIGLFIITKGNFLYLLTRRAGNSDAWDVLRSNYLVSLASNTSLVFLPILINIKIFQNKKWKFLIIPYVIAILVSYLITGARGFIIYSIIATFILVSSQKSIKISVLLGLAVILIFFFSGLGLIRRSMSDTENLFSNIQERKEVEEEWYYEITNYQLQLRDEMVYSNADEAGYLFGFSYLNLVFFPVPRFIMGDSKPIFIDALVANNFWNRDDVGLPLNAMTESYYNFGWFGLIMFLLLGRFMSFITNKIILNPSYILIISTTILCMFAQTYSTTYLVYVEQFTLILVVTMWFGKKVRIVNNKLQNI